MKSLQEKIVHRRVHDLVPFDRNSRTHSDAQVAQIASSIEEFGFTNPVLIDEANTIIAGEGRMLAAKKLKMEAVPCIVLAGLTAAQKAAYVIADNKLALNAGWNTDKLAAELASLGDHDFDFNLTGFSDDEIEKMLGNVEVELASIAASAPSASSPPPSSNIVPEAEDDAVELDEADTPPEPTGNVWKGMPEFDQQDKAPFRTMVIHFCDQAEVAEFAELIEQKVTDKTKSVWFRKQEKVIASGEVYA